MRPALCLLTLFLATAVWAQIPVQNANQTPLQSPNQTPLPDSIRDPVYICPMDKDVRSNNPGNCARCGMKLVAGIPDPVEYHLDLTVTPRPLKVRETANLKFVVHNPWNDKPVTNFLEVHEKLFHAFVVSQDLQ